MAFGKTRFNILTEETDWYALPGIHQGITIGPFLFIFCIDDMYYDLENKLAYSAESNFNLFYLAHYQTGNLYSVYMDR